MPFCKRSHAPFFVRGPVVFLCAGPLLLWGLGFFCPLGRPRPRWVGRGGACIFRRANTYCFKVRTIADLANGRSHFSLHGRLKFSKSMDLRISRIGGAFFNARTMSFAVDLTAEQEQHTSFPATLARTLPRASRHIRRDAPAMRAEAPVFRLGQNISRS